MKINLDAWQLNNPDWVAQRKQKWKKIKAYWDKQKHWGGDYIREDKKTTKKFFDSGQYDVRFLTYREFAILHPELTLEEMRTFLEEKEMTWYEFEPSAVDDWFFVESLVPNNINQIVMLALVGENYHQAAELRGFDPKQKAKKAIKDSLSRFFEYFRVAHYRYYPIELGVAHIQSIFEFIDASNIELVKFNIDNFARNLKRVITDGNLDNTPERMAVAQNMLDFITSENVHESVRELTLPYKLND